MNPLVTGMGCICAAGNDVESTVTSLYSGVRNPVPPSRLEVNLDKVYPVFEIEDDLDDFAPDANRTTKLALIAAEEALSQAGITADVIKNKRIGVCMGTTVGCTLSNEPFYRAFKDGSKPELGPIHRYLANNPAEYLMRYYGFQGPVATIANACSSGTDAIGMAKGWIQSGRCDIAIAGGVDALSRITYLGFISLLITSTQACRPFDVDRTGLNLGEGAGIVVLEHSDSAKERGVDSYAECAGFGCNADSYHPTAPHPDGVGLINAIHRALEEAKIGSDQIGFINAHGTSTPDNDKTEGKVIAKLYKPGIPAVSTKAYTGHTLGAAGGLEAIFTIRSLIDGKLPATAGFENVDPECVIAPTTELTTIDAEYAISHSLAFGGNNSALIFKRSRS